MFILCNNVDCDKDIRCILIATLNGCESVSVWVFAFGFLHCTDISRMIYGFWDGICECVGDARSFRVFGVSLGVPLRV